MADGYLDLPGASGDYVDTPDHADFDVTGDIDIWVEVAVADWTPSATQSLLSKWVATGNQRSWSLQLNITTGRPRLQWSVAGTASSGTDTATASTGFTDGTRHWIRATMDVDDGAGNRVVKFYTSNVSTVPGPGDWTQLGTTVTTATTTSIFSGTAPPEIGSINAGTTQLTTGKLYRARLYDGYDGAGTLKASIDLTANNGSNTYTDVQGHVWSEHGSANFVATTDAFPAPAAVAAVASVPAPTISATGDAVVSPAAVAATATVPAPAVQVGTTTTPSAVAATASVPSPSVSTGSSVSPASVAALAAVPTPTIAATGDAIVSPAAVAATAAVPDPSVHVGVTPAPATVAVVASVGAPAFQTGSTVSLSTVAALAGVGAPTVSAGASVSPATVAAVAAVGAPQVTLGAAPSPAAVAATAAVSAPTFIVGQSISPSAVAAVAAVPTPGVNVSLMFRSLEGGVVVVSGSEASATLVHGIEGEAG